MTAGCSLPLLSIITPSYNHGAYIRETIESVLSQDYANVEHIVKEAMGYDNSPLQWRYCIERLFLRVLGRSDVAVDAAPVTGFIAALEQVGLGGTTRWTQAMALRALCELSDEVSLQQRRRSVAVALQAIHLSPTLLRFPQARTRIRRAALGSSVNTSLTRVAALGRRVRFQLARFWAETAGVMREEH